jgi:hypothetical protein
MPSFSLSLVHISLGIYKGVGKGEVLIITGVLVIRGVGETVTTAYFKLIFSIPFCILLTFPTARYQIKVNKDNIIKAILLMSYTSSLK